MSIRTLRNSKRWVAAAAAVAIGLSGVAISNPASATQNVVESRVGGLDRYATAAQVALATFAAPNPNVILASGENFPDGLAAAGLAGAANAPVLLTRSDSLPAVTANAMAAIFGASAIKTVHIMGGEAAVSAAVEAQIESLGYTVNRVAGANRYATAAAIAAFQATLAPVGTTQVAGAVLRTAILATGADFPDALAAGAPAFAGRHPILLTAPTSLPSATAEALSNLSVQRVIVLGGENAVSPAVVEAVEALGILVTRVGGANRGETAALLAGALVSPLAAGGFNFYGTPLGASPAPAACLPTGAAGNIALIVSGNSFADAMAAAPHAGACRAPILIAGSPATSVFLGAASSAVGVVRAIGGTAAVSAEALTAAKDAATTVTPTVQLSANAGNAVVAMEFSELIDTSAHAGRAVTINNTTTVCNANAVLPPLVLANGLVDPGTCYFANAAGRTTVWVRLAAPLAANDLVAVSGFRTPATLTSAPRTIAPTSLTVAPVTTRLTGSIVGAAQGSTTISATFSRPVTLGGDAASVTVTRGSNAPVEVGPLAFANTTATQLAVTGTTLALAGLPAIAGDASSPTQLRAGDIITVTTAAATAVVAGSAPNGGTLAQNITFLVPPAGAAPAASQVTGVITETGGVLTVPSPIADSSVVFQARQARPDTGAGSISVAFVQGGGLSTPTTAAATLNQVTGVNQIVVTLGTNAAGDPNATSSAVANAVNASPTASPLVTATAANPANTTVLGVVSATQIPAGQKTITVTVTTSKPLAAGGVVVGSLNYDAAGNGFNQLTLDTLSPAVLAGATSFTASRTITVSAVSNIAPIVPGTSTLRLTAGALTDTTAQTSGNQVIAFSSP